MVQIATRTSAVPSVQDDAALYDHDLAAWCERQAALLRQVAAAWAGEAQPDWPNLIEEIEDLGKSQRRHVESLLIQAMMHLLKLQADPTSLDVPHWTIETRGFLLQARRVYAPSMRQAINLDDLYGDAVFQLAGNRLAAGCPYSLDDLLTASPDIAALTAKGAGTVGEFNRPPVE